MTVTPVGVRIGELSRRVGVPPETLRAWERRYGVLHPARTKGGYRVYGRDDQRRARRMRRLIDEGWAAGEAAAAAAGGEEWAARAPAAGSQPEREPDVAAPATAAGLLEPLLRFDAAAGATAFDRVLGARTLDAALRDVVLPALRAVGDGWARGEVSVAQEHFVTDLVGGRLRGLAREWDEGLGPRAVLACPAGERHDLGLLCCGLALRARGWRVTYLGADTPRDALAGAVDALAPALVVLAIVQAEVLAAALTDVRALARRARVAAGGDGARADRLEEAGVEHLAGDPVTAAAALRPQPS